VSLVTLSVRRSIRTNESQRVGRKSENVDDDYEGNDGRRDTFDVEGNVFAVADGDGILA